MNSETSDGSRAGYYDLPAGAKKLGDLIADRNMNHADGEMFCALYRKGRAGHSDALRDARKVLYYAQAEVTRLEAVNTPPMGPAQKEPGSGFAGMGPPSKDWLGVVLGISPTFVCQISGSAQDARFTLDASRLHGLGAVAQKLDIRGRLAARGFRVLSLGDNGDTITVRGRFEASAPATDT